MENDQNQQAVPPLIDQTKANKDNEEYFNLVVDDIAYRVEFKPFFFNEQVRYYVSINAGPTDVLCGTQACSSLGLLTTQRVYCL